MSCSSQGRGRALDLSSVGQQQVFPEMTTTTTKIWEKQKKMDLEAKQTFLGVRFGGTVRSMVP